MTPPHPAGAHEAASPRHPQLPAPADAAAGPRPGDDTCSPGGDRGRAVPHRSALTALTALTRPVHMETLEPL